MAKKRDLPAVLGRRELTEPTPVAPKPKTFSFLERMQTRRGQTYKGTVDASTELLHSLSENARAAARLHGIKDGIDHDCLALEVHTENLEQQKEDIQWEREKNRLLRNHERERLLTPAKQSNTALPQPEEDVELGEEED
jgi:hypothetical protein